MTLNSQYGHETVTTTICSVNRVISLNKFLENYNSLQQHQIRSIIAIMSSSDSTVFWFLLYKMKLFCNNYRQLPKSRDASKQKNKMQDLKVKTMKITLK